MHLKYFITSMTNLESSHLSSMSFHCISETNFVPVHSEYYCNDPSICMYICLYVLHLLLSRWADSHHRLCKHQNVCFTCHVKCTSLISNFKICILRMNEKSLQAKITNTKRSQWGFIFIRAPFWKRSRWKQFIHLLSNAGPTTKANWSPSPRIFHCMDHDYSTFHCNLSNISWHFLFWTKDLSDPS